MNILDLPNEMLLMICSYLNGEERKRLSTVCCRFEELIFHPREMERWVLRLSHYQPMVDPFGCWFTVFRIIEADVLERSNRQYRTVRMTLPSRLNETEPNLTVEWLRTIASKLTSVKHLWIDESHITVVLQLFSQLKPFLAGLESLAVSVLVAKRHTSNVLLALPNLRSIVWTETQGQTDGRMEPLVQLVAPVLKRAVVRSVNPNYSIPDYRGLLTLQAFDQLRELDIQVSNTLFGLLSCYALPSLAELSLHCYRTDVDTNWEPIARNLPALRTLTMSYCQFKYKGCMPLQTLMTGCPHLAELHLIAIDLMELFASRVGWERIHTLHIHDCRMEIPDNVVVSVVLPAVRDLCLDLHPILNGRMQFYLPEVRRLGIFQADSNLDIMETPKLERLFLSRLGNLNISFLRQPLPNLRHFFHEIEELGTTGYVVCPPMVQLEHLTIISWLEMNLHLENIDALRPNLKSIRLIGMNRFLHVSGSTFRSIFRLRHLESLLISNVHVTESASSSIELLPILQDVRVRSLCATNDLPLLSVDETTHPRVRLEKHRLEKIDIYRCNSHLLPSLYDDELCRYERCLSKMRNWL